MFVEIVEVLHVAHQTAGFAEQNGEKVKLNGQCCNLRSRSFIDLLGYSRYTYISVSMGHSCRL